MSRGLCALRGLLLACLCGAALACGGTPGLASITLTPATLALYTGQSQTLTATGSFDDGSRRPLTAAEVNFASTAGSVATVDASGAVHAAAPGTATLTATTTAAAGTAGRTASATVTVTAPPPTLTAITLTGATSELDVGATAQLTVTGAFSDGSHAPFTAGVTFASFAPGIATVSASGVVSGVAPGLTAVTATASGAPQASLAVSVVGPHFDVFVDGIAQHLDFVPFDGTVSSDLAPDSAVLLANGHQPLRFTFPQTGSIGGALVSSAAPLPDLSGYDAITFWAKASAPLTLETVGLGNDASGSATGTRYSVETSGLALGTTFQQYTVPLPLPAKLSAQAGLFHFVEHHVHSGATDVHFWLGDLRYQRLGATGTGAPSLKFTLGMQSVQAGHSFALMNTDLVIDWTGGTSKVVTPLVRPAFGYFTFSSSDPSVATIDPSGLVASLKAGQASLSAALGAVHTSSPLVLTVTP